MARAKQKDIANEVRKVYTTRMSADDIDVLEASVAKKDLPVKKESATIKPIAPKTEKMPEKELLNEAKKYKSADEFVKAKTNFIHETNSPNIKEFRMDKI